MAATFIRTAEPADAEAICRVHVASIREVCAPFYDAAVIDAWSGGKQPSRYVEVMATRAFFVAVLGDDVVGFSHLVPETGEVHAVYVRPDCLRRGIGTELLRALEAVARARSLVRLRLESSINAVPFYERHGFSSDGAGVVMVAGGAELPCVKMHKDL